MSLTVDEVRRIAFLARLRLSPEEESMFTRQLAEIVDYIDQLGTFEGMTPEPGDRLAQPGEDEDRPAPCLPREAFLANAPAVLDGFLRVPEVKVGRRDDS